MLNISAFARLSGLSPKSLRHYHDRGLLIPAHVDEFTGYRTYALDQVEEAVRIRVLRRGGMPVETIREVLANPDRADSLIDEYREALRSRREQEDQALAAARAFVEERGAVRIRRAPTQPYASVTLDAVANPDDATGSAAEDGPGNSDPKNETTAGGISELNARVDEAGDRLVTLLHDAGAEVTGPVSTVMIPDEEGLRIAVYAPVTSPTQPAPGSTHETDHGIEYGTLPARDEAVVSVPLPERDGDESIHLALAGLFAERDGRRPDVRTLRQTVLRDEGRVEFAIALLETDR